MSDAATIREQAAADGRLELEGTMDLVLRDGATCDVCGAAVAEPFDDRFLCAGHRVARMKAVLLETRL